MSHHALMIIACCCCAALIIAGALLCGFASRKLEAIEDDYDHFDALDYAEQLGVFALGIVFIVAGALISLTCVALQ